MFRTIFRRFFWTSTAIILFTVAVVSVSMLGLLNKYVEDERLSTVNKASAAIETPPHRWWLRQ